MDRKYRYQYDSSQKILYKHYYGIITIEDIVSSWIYAFENSLIPDETKGFILDYTSANFDIIVHKYTEISDFYKKHIDIFGGTKIAIVTDDPKDVVVPILVESADDGYQSRPFSTLHSAIDWVHK